MEFALREEFRASPEEVFAALTDVPGAEKWMPDLVRIELLTEGPYGVGTKWRETRTMFGREASEVFEVKAVTPGKSVEFYVDGRLGSSKRGEYRFVYELEESDGGTVMNVQASITGLGIAGVLFGWLFKGMFRKAIRKDHAALRRFVWSQSEQRSAMKFTTQVASTPDRDHLVVEVLIDDQNFCELWHENGEARVEIYPPSEESLKDSGKTYLAWDLPFDKLMEALQSARETIRSFRGAPQ